MDTVAASWVLGSSLVVLVSVVACAWAVRTIPSTPRPEPPNLFGGAFAVFLGFFVLGVGAYIALAYWLGRVGGLWAVAGAIGVVMTSLAGCVRVARSARKNPSSFDGYPFVGLIALGIGALVALGLGLEGATSQR